MDSRQTCVEDVDTHDHFHDTGPNAQDSRGYQGDRCDVRGEFCDVGEPAPYADPGKPYGAWERIGAKKAAESAANEATKAAAGRDLQTLPHPNDLNQQTTTPEPVTDDRRGQGSRKRNKGGKNGSKKHCVIF